MQNPGQQSPPPVSGWHWPKMLSKKFPPFPGLGLNLGLLDTTLRSRSGRHEHGFQPIFGLPPWQDVFPGHFRPVSRGWKSQSYSRSPVQRLGSVPEARARHTP